MRANHKHRENRQRAYTEWVDIVIVAMIKSLGFVPKSDDARAGWLSFGLDRINGTGKPSAFAGG